MWRRLSEAATFSQGQLQKASESVTGALQSASAAAPQLNLEKVGSSASAMQSTIQGALTSASSGVPSSIQGAIGSANDAVSSLSPPSSFSAAANSVSALTQNSRTEFSKALSSATAPLRSVPITEPPPQTAQPDAFKQPSVATPSQPVPTASQQPFSSSSAPSSPIATTTPPLTADALDVRGSTTSSGISPNTQQQYIRANVPSVELESTTLSDGVVPTAQPSSYSQSLPPPDSTLQRVRIPVSATTGISQGVIYGNPGPLQALSERDQPNSAPAPATIVRAQHHSWIESFQASFPWNSTNQRASTVPAATATAPSITVAPPESDVATFTTPDKTKSTAHLLQGGSSYSSVVAPNSDAAKESARHARSAIAIASVGSGLEIGQQVLGTSATVSADGAVETAGQLPSTTSIASASSSSEVLSGGLISCLSCLSSLLSSVILFKQ